MSGKHQQDRGRVSGPAAEDGFTLVEMLVVIGIITVLIAILVPVLSAARRAAQRTECGSNLRQIGHAIHLYANQNRGWIPRDATLGRSDRIPWPMLLGKYLGKEKELTEADLPTIKVLQCPSHPQKGIPTGYLINAFAFETAPNWKPDGPIKITAIKRSVGLPWMFDSANNFPLAAPPPLSDKVFGVQFHDVYHPEHMPSGSKHRISDTRHGNNANLLYLDGHVTLIQKDGLFLEMLDDGVRVRATPMPATTPDP